MNDHFRPSAVVFASLYSVGPILSLAWAWKSLTPEVTDTLGSFSCLLGLSCVSNFLMLVGLLSRLKFTADGLNNKAEAFVILHRIAAMHHRRMQDLESHVGTKQRYLTNNTELFERRRAADGNSEPIQPRTQRHFVRFKASLLRGADCHSKIQYRHRFGKVMTRIYGAEGSENGASNWHSFVELDLHDPDQLRMWWATRKFVEAGLLDHKVGTELVLVLSAGILFVLVVFAVFWYLIMGSNSYIACTMISLEVLAIGLAFYVVINSCVRLNSSLKNDGLRLTFVQHDLISDIAEYESRRRGQGDSGGRAPRKVSRTGLLPAISVQTAVSDASRSWSPSSSGSGAPTPRRNDRVDPDTARYRQNKITLRLLGILIDHIDRDYHPMQLFGVTIDGAVRRRIILLLTSASFTMTVRGITHLVTNVDEHHM